MGVTSTSGEGGSANESGSLHRNGAAAYFAAFGLAGRSVDGTPGKVPVRLALETSDAVDDIVVTFKDGSRWYAQAKRAAGLDATLDDVARQWSAQPLEEGDALVLVARELTRNLRLAGDLLQRRAVDPQCPTSATQQAALGRLTERLDRSAPARGEAVAARARLITLEVEGPSDRDALTAAAALEGTVVHVGAGDRSVDALRAAMQGFAAQRLETGIDHWLSALSAAGIELVDDENGAPGSARHREQIAIAAYRAHWASRLDSLDVSYLINDIDQVPVEGLARGLVVEWDADDRQDRSEDSLVTMVRRNRRLVVEGLPGIGKSAAMRQLAAWLSADDNAPLGILVDLRRLASAIASPDDVTLATVLDQAARSVSSVDEQLMRVALAAEIGTGHVVLLLDGLDETHKRAGTVAAGINGLVKGLHADCGVILTTRASSLGSAQILGFPRVRLTTPRNLRHTLDSILGAIAVVRTTDVARDSWLAERSAWLDESFERESHVWTIPLLATLGVDRLAKDIPETSNPGALLSDVVDDSVKRWEFDRAKGLGLGMDAEMRSEMLTAGFTAIGHLLDAIPSAPVSDVEATIAESLKDWNLSAALVTVIAQQVREFWDESVGIFVEKDGLVSARSRLFSELGDARFALGLPAERRSAWIRSALTSDDKRVAVMIAGLGDTRVYDDLIECANRLPADTEALRAATWLADDEFETKAMGAEQVKSLVALLARLAEEGAAPLPNTGNGVVNGWLAAAKNSADATNPPGYAFALALARLTIPASVEPMRAEALGRLALPEPHALVLRALVELSTRSGVDGALSDEAAKHVATALDAAPASEREAPSSNSSGVLKISPGPRVIPGLVRVAELAIPFLGQLGPKAPDQIYRIAWRSTMRQFAAIQSKMSDLGYTNPDPHDTFSSFASLFEGFEDRSGWGFFLRAWAVASASEPIGGPNETWRIKSIADLVQSSGWARTGVAEFRVASKELPETVLAWSTAYVRALGLDARLVAEQASAILRWDDRRGDPVEAMLAHSFEHPDVEPNFSGWDADDLELLMPALASSSPWISRTTLRFFLQDRSPAVAQAISEVNGKYTRETLRNLLIAQLFNCEQRAAEALRLLETDELVAQVVAAEFTGWSDDPELFPVRDLALASADGTVRARAGADLEQALGAQYWSCWFCGHRNDQATTSCQGEKCSLTRGSSWGIDEK